MSQLVTQLAEADFAAEVEHADLPVFVDFWAPWCGPCKALEPVVDELAQMYRGRIKFVKVNADENKELTQRFDVRGLPTIVLLKNNELVERISGAQSKSRFAALLDRHAPAAAPAAGASAKPAKTWRAFWGDAALRQSTVDRVRAHIHAGQIRDIGSVPPLCDEAKGKYSLIGAALHGTDLERYEGTFGIPAGVALLEEYVHCFATQEATDAQGGVYYTLLEPTRNYPLDWLEGISPGADLQTVTPRFLHALLLDLVDAPLPFGAVVADSIKPAVRRVADLHARLGAGDAPTANEWKDAREAAAGIAPDQESDPVSWGVATCAETTAWPTEDLGNAVQSGLGIVFFGLRETAIRQAYSVEQWAAREALVAVVREKQKSEPDMSREAFEANADVQALRNMQRETQPTDNAQQVKLKLELGERWHRRLMTSLAALDAPAEAR